MSKRRTAEQIGRLLREAQRDLAQGLTVADVCRKLGHHRGLLPTAALAAARPAQADDARRVRHLEAEVERPQAARRRTPPRQADAPGRRQKKW